jgi:hypothetical protein
MKRNTDHTFLDKTLDTQDCIGPELPTSLVTYPASNAFCESNAGEATIDHAVTLGTYCDIAGEQFFYHGDLSFDCAKPEHNFDYVYGDMYGVNDTRYICKESATFATGSSSSNMQTISSVTIITDENWLVNPDGCFTFKSVATTPTSPPIPAPVPSTDPPTPDQTIGTVYPSTSPTSYPSTGPTKAIVTTDQPSTKPVTNTTQASSPVTPIETNTSREGSSSSIVGIVIGSVVGGFAFAAVIGFIIFFRRRQNNGVSISTDHKKEYTSNSNVYNTDSHTDDDFTALSSPTSGISGSGVTVNSLIARASSSSSSSPPPVQQLFPVRETNNDVEGNYKRDVSVYIPTPDMPISNNIITTPSRSTRLSNTSHNYVDMKDQCRTVIPDTTSPTTNTANAADVPFAIAISSSNTRTKVEPTGRLRLDP